MATRLIRWQMLWSGLGEVGQFGWCVQPQAAVSQSDLEDAVGAFIDNFASGEDWALNLRSTLAADQAYDHVRAYYYDDAKAAAAAGAEGNIGHAQGVGTGAALLPLQAALVATLNTGHSGSRYRGRMYLPVTGQGLSANHLMSQGVLDNLGQALCGAEDGQDCLFTVSANASAFGAAPYGIYSRTRDAFSAITSVSIDNKVDTQRRRAESQQATLRSTYPARDQFVPG